MSLILRSFFRDPRPLSRSLRRWNDDFLLEDWPLRKVRGALPVYESPFRAMEDVSRQMVNTVNRMQDWAEDMETLDEFVSRFDENSSLRPRTGEGDGSAIVRRTEDGGLQLALDVTSFKPDDLKIKLVDDNLVIEAESETSGKDLYRRSHFKRWFKVPEDCKLDEIKSRISEDNKLLIDLPLNKPLKNNERTIPIEVEKTQAIKNDQQQQDNTGHQKQQPEQQQ